MGDTASFPDSESAPPADCRRCGACCFSPSPMFVPVGGDDWSRLGSDAGQLAVFNGHRAFMRMAGGHCAALDVQANPDGSPDYFCTIYDRRPQICRALERGSPQCLGEFARRDGSFH